MKRRHQLIAALALVLLAGCGAVGTGEAASTASGGAAASTTAPAATATASATTTATAAVETPAQGASWQIQYAGTLPETGAEAAQIAQIWDVDGADTDADWVANANKAGIYTICYFNAGGWEDWRDDADQFPSTLLGNPLDGWDGEQWLDIRQIDQLLPIMEARMDECAAKGFNAVDPDNLDGYLNDSGFNLTAADTIAYYTALANAAHQRGLAISQKNALTLTEQLQPLADFAVNEECVAYNECDAYQPYLDAGKAILHVEYDVTLKQMCDAAPAGFSSELTNLDLSETGQRCGE